MWWAGEKLPGVADSDALFLVREGTLLPGDRNMVGHIIEKKPDKSSFTTLGIWIPDLTGSPQTPVKYSIDEHLHHRGRTGPERLSDLPSGHSEKVEPWR